jgi:intracellular multiplication protein IcmK
MTANILLSILLGLSLTGTAFAAKEPIVFNNDKGELYKALKNNANKLPNGANANILAAAANSTNNSATAGKPNISQPGLPLPPSIDGEDLAEQAPRTLREEAFQQLLNRSVPLKPEQILELRRRLDEVNKAESTPAQAPPTPISSTLVVDLSPGATPPIIRLAMGFVTSVVFVDSTGQPWPVANYSLGNPKFNIQWDKTTNTLFLQSNASYLTANLAVRLEDLDTPIMISLVTGQKEVDFRIDLQVNGLGPNATPPLVTHGYSAPPSLLSVLDNVPPKGSTELKVAGNYGRAWLYNGNLIFRTKLTVLSPAWKNYVSSIDGTKVYEFNETPLILASQNGRPINIELSGL